MFVGNFDLSEIMHKLKTFFARVFVNFLGRLKLNVKEKVKKV